MLKVGIKLNDLFAALSVQTLGTQIETIATMEDTALRRVDGADRRKVCAERNRNDDGSWRSEYTVIGQRMFCPGLRFSRPSSGLPACPYRSQTRPQNPARRDQNLGPRMSLWRALSPGSTTSSRVSRLLMAA